MPRVERRRTVAAPPERVWELVADPYSLPRWWPRTARVENVEHVDGATEWTKVLQTEEGRGVRADYRCVAAVENERYEWEQQVSGTPFERHLRRASLAIELQPDGDGTEVALGYEQSLRGLSRLGGTMMRRGQAATLEEALDGIERALG